VEALTRVPEPEVMDDPAHARAYSEADFSGPHGAFVDEFWRRFPELTTRSFDGIDLGCGPADVTVRFARAHPHARVVGIDASEPMLELGRERVVSEGLDDRVALERGHLPDVDLPSTTFDAVVSNSLLHHLADPADLWSTVALVARPGAAVFVMDLCRPVSDADVEALVDRYASDEPDLLRHDFRASLRAAYRPDEVAAQLTAASLSFDVEPLGDRHLVVWGRR
jgi:ubiquinone/menaquinone biosynthesis C-methylase UbiE